MNKKLYLLLILSLISCSAFSQAGKATYSFLELPVSSRQAALGGSNVSLRDNDLNFAFRNPALLTDETDNSLGLNMANYLADIRFGSAMYGKKIGKENFIAIIVLNCIAKIRIILTQRSFNFQAWKFAENFNTINVNWSFFR